MSEPRPDLRQVAALEADIVRLFRVDDAEGPGFSRRRSPADRAAFLARRLGVSTVDPEHIALICLADLGEQGLEEYLVEGQGIRPQALFADLEMIAGQTGHVLVVTSPAFGGAAVTLRPQPGLTALGAWPREGAEAPRLVLPAGERPLPAAKRQPQGGHLVLKAVIALGLVLLCGAFAIRYVR